MDFQVISESPLSHGTLIIQVLHGFTQSPLEHVQILISAESDAASATEPLTVTTDASGMTPEVILPAPSEALSQQPDPSRPYATYRLELSLEGYHDLAVDGVEILGGSRSKETVSLTPVGEASPEEPFILIPPHTLYSDDPAKIPEPEIKDLDETGEIVLSRVVIPETIIVHDGAPGDSSAPNYYVPYRDYIKNVASSEIYSTWEDAAIRANVLAIQSFTLNRVYTEWYRNRGYDYTITSSTAYDQKWIYGRNIFQRISEVVDEMFTAYLSRPNVRQPLFTQYCDGSRVTCPGWLSQWGSQELARRGYSAIEILRHYYGSSIYINTAEEIEGIPFSWPGNDLTIGSRGQKVYQLQEQLNTIHSAYPSIPEIAVDGIYGPATAEAVKTFQSIFGLPATGITDYPTWFKISEIFVGVSKIAEKA